MINKIKKIINTDKGTIEEFVKNISKIIKKGKILDAGAGDLRYKKYFKKKGVEYISVDFQTVNIYPDIDIIANLSNIPLKNESVDYILCTQVLEHVPNPEKVLKEFHRILKKKGTLFMTIPLLNGEHEIPYDFFRYTQFGIKNMLEEEHFQHIQIKPRGGYFITMSFLIQYFTTYMEKNFVLKIILIPISIFTKYILPIFFYNLDYLDKNKTITLGYKIIAKKEN